MAIVLDHPETEQQQQTWEQARSKGIDLEKLPRHIAVIMDGNGRWARGFGKPRVEGHRQGARTVREIVTTCRELGVEYLTLYAFSSENWRRPKLEVSALMILLETYLRAEIKEMQENGVRLNAIGNIDSLPAPARKALEQARTATADCKRLVLTLALSYGGRNEIVEAAKQLMRQVQNGELDPETLTPELFSSALMTADMPDPDLLIRTSGEMRVSNFLLWQIAYAEMWVTQTLWPDFDREHLFDAIVDFQRRERRFGLVEAASTR